MSVSILLIFTKSIIIKWTVLIGVILYNILIPHFRIIVPNYYAIRDWIAICGGLVYLMAVDIQ
jgi:hypothetical protein